MNQDIGNSLQTAPGWAGATVSTNTDTTSTIVIDTQGYEATGFAVYAGARTDGSYLLKIMETDNADGTTGAAEVPSYTTQQTMTASNTVGKVSAPRGKRYRTLRLTSTAVTTGCVFKGAIALQGAARNNPVA